MRKISSAALGLLLCGIVFGTKPEPARACAVILRPGMSGWIDQETAIIVYDAKTKTEQFIRKASFGATTSADFGFLVPTPTLPTLSLAEDAAFNELKNTTAARHEYHTKITTVFGFDLARWSPFSRSTVFGNVTSKVGMAPGGVKVISEQRVGNYDTAILKATDAKALQEWLSSNGYESTPAITDWLAVYVKSDWYLTAFKLTKDGPTSAEGTTVRISFQTERPFYPYREPISTNPGNASKRSLTVYYLSGERATGTLGEKGEWPGNTVWADKVPDAKLASIFKHLKLKPDEQTNLLTATPYLNEFQDDSFPRPGTDEVYFQPSADQTAIERPPIIHTTEVIHYWPGEFGALVVGVLFVSAIASGIVLVIRRRRRTI